MNDPPSAASLASVGALMIANLCAAMYDGSVLIPHLYSVVALGVGECILVEQLSCCVDPEYVSREGSDDLVCLTPLTSAALWVGWG